MDIAVFLLLLLVVVVGLMLSTTEHTLRRTNRRIARLDRKIDLVLDHLAIHESDPELEQVVALVRERKKIQAIKLYREITGAELKEAKDAVEHREAQI